jgi:acetylornithine deacetylase/succinyl-diaminopimelate desuccinylase-like protein
MIREASLRQSEEMVKKQLGVKHWVHDVDYLESLELLASKPTINIEGLVGGYTGPGGKTILPHKAVAKIDMRLVPDMTALGTLELLRAHLAKKGFKDIEVNMTGGYDPTSTSADSLFVKAEQAVYKRNNINPILWPRQAGSWPGYIFTGAPLNLAAIQFGLGHGNGAHAPNEYYVIESSNPKIQGYDGAARAQIDFMYQVASMTT